MAAAEHSASPDLRLLSPNDDAITRRLVAAVHALQGALDEAAAAGLVVEPSISAINQPGREDGAKAYRINVALHRKLL